MLPASHQCQTAPFRGRHRHVYSFSAWSASASPPGSASTNAPFRYVTRVPSAKRRRTVMRPSATRRRLGVPYVCRFSLGTPPRIRHDCLNSRSSVAVRGAGSLSEVVQVPSEGHSPLAIAARGVSPVRAIVPSKVAVLLKSESLRCAWFSDRASARFIDCLTSSSGHPLACPRDRRLCPVVAAHWRSATARVGDRREEAARGAVEREATVLPARTLAEACQSLRVSPDRTGDCPRTLPRMRMPRQPASAAVRAASSPTE